MCLFHQIVFYKLKQKITQLSLNKHILQEEDKILETRKIIKETLKSVYCKL